MPVDIVMPKLGESVTEGTVSRWLKKVGDPVGRDEPVLEITTDKIDTDVPAVKGGILTEILIVEGTTVSVGERLGVITIEGEEERTTDGVTNEAAAEVAVPVSSLVPDDEKIPITSPEGRFYSPLVKRMAREEQVTVRELDAIKGSGRNGRVTKKDLLSYLKSRSDKPQLPAYEADVFPRNYTAVDADVSTMNNVRKAIAEHMVRSKRISPHVTSVSEVDMTTVVHYREQNKARFFEREGFKLTLTPFFISAIVDALRKHPLMNASLDGDQIIQWKHINFGIAVGLEKGVIVPVIRHAETMNFIGLARSAYELALKAHERRLTPDDMEGGTFTLTNPGMWGTLFGTPVINQPEAGIIATGAVQKQLKVQDDDSLAIRSIMLMSMSYDHRLIDGMYAAQFTRSITENLEAFDFDHIGL